MRGVTIAKSGRWTQVKGGLRLTGICLLGFAWILFVFAGIAIAFSPSPYPPVAGWLALVVAAVIASVTVDSWVKALPGLLAFAALNAVFMIVSGHLINDPTKLISRGTATGMALLYSGSAAVSATLTTRKLTLADRAALSVFVICFIIGISNVSLALLGLGLMFSCLAFAWVYYYLQARRRI